MRTTGNPNQYSGSDRIQAGFRVDSRRADRLLRYPRSDSRTYPRTLPCPWGVQGPIRFSDRFSRYGGPYHDERPLEEWPAGFGPFGRFELPLPVAGGVAYSSDRSRRRVACLDRTRNDRARRLVRAAHAGRTLLRKTDLLFLGDGRLAQDLRHVGSRGPTAGPAVRHVQHADHGGRGMADSRSPYRPDCRAVLCLDDPAGGLGSTARLRLGPGDLDQPGPVVLLGVGPRRFHAAGLGLDRGGRRGAGAGRFDQGAGGRRPGRNCLRWLPHRFATAAGHPLLPCRTGLERGSNHSLLVVPCHGACLSGLPGLLFRRPPLPWFPHEVATARPGAVVVLLSGPHHRRRSLARLPAGAGSRRRQPLAEPNARGDRRPRQPAPAVPGLLVSRLHALPYGCAFPRISRISGRSFRRSRS